MENKEVIIEGVDVSNFCLVCYYDNKTNELVRIEQYNDNDSSMYSDIESYKYGYNAKIVKPEEIIKQLKCKEQELQEAMDNYVKLDNQRVKEYNELLDKCNNKEQECEELKKYLNQIRDEELSHLDIEWDEYETSARQEDYSNIITLVERALGEIDD